MKASMSRLAIFIILILFFSCASEKVNYELPSAGSKEKPTWVGTHKTTRDTIFIVVRVPRQTNTALKGQVQEAQSALHRVMVNELDGIIRDYWEQQGKTLTDEEEFDLQAGLPRTLEAVMKHVTVTDGWDEDQERSYLCALDYQDASNEIMTDMKIDDIAFRSYLKRRMDELSRKYK